MCLLPAILLGFNFYAQRLGANPLEVLTRETGVWTLRLLLITLSLTPIKLVFKVNFVISYRRMFGLYAYFYGCLHLITYIWFDQFFDLNSMFADIFERPFITVGCAAILLMTPLALTSFNWMIKKMGGKNWQRLHYLSYLIAILGCIHYLWLVKIDLFRPVIYSILLGILFGIRIAYKLLKKYRHSILKSRQDHV
ncbi:inner membrane heme subunit for periplasmic YedYZ reductase [Gammaproteobacteria bacterium]|nr:inner membrane heme subunit for periplasmic YedYZ reductase [Gammaproteobacteria bacterium]